ncbi:hypothetical protein J5Y03_09960 [Bacillus sp. RG28]|uniref:Actin-like protein N-terminal domain-containing protein n=1 Tax=Gottfriedia endophytica TaxID=2820819 RepID=A0A940NMV8_9BACI|nr:hypothetical protein [Gottfriedia endophytica]MBP0725511.1 hypothetical protein [Gottfriedia endophytica]
MNTSVNLISKVKKKPLNVLSNKTELMAIDAGNYNVKVRFGFNLEKFCSAVLLYDGRQLDQRYGPDDMRFRIETMQGDILYGVAGNIADMEGEYGSGRVYGNTKNHDEGKVRVLLAVYRYAKSDRLNIVVAQPYKFHSLEKEEIISSLKGTHLVTVDYGDGPIAKTFTIENVSVLAEGAGLFFINPIKKGIVRYIDIGSGTVNCLTFKDGVCLKDQSTTLNFGTETRLDDEDANLESLARGIYSNMSKKWNKNDNVIVGGGCTKDIISILKKYYINADIVRPGFTDEKGKTLIAHPEFANAWGMYEVGEKVYGK